MNMSGCHFLGITAVDSRLKTGAEHPETQLKDCTPVLFILQQVRTIWDYTWRSVAVLGFSRAGHTALRVISPKVHRRAQQVEEVLKTTASP